MTSQTPAVPQPDERFELPQPVLGLFEGWAGKLRVEEIHEPDKLVIRSEVPGIDPERDLDLNLSHGVLTIHVERQENKQFGTKARLRSEFHYGSFTRAISLPPGVTRKDVTATYQDGILEITVQLPKESDHTSGKIPVSRGHKTTTNGHPVAGAKDAPSPAPAPA